MTAAESPVLLALSDGVATVTLNRPHVLNALDAELAAALTATLERVEADEAARVVVLRGAGDAFMAGGDIGSFRRMLAAHPDRGEAKTAIRAMIDQAQGIALALRRMAKPVIASVHGGCAGFGLSLMLASDLALAAEDCKFTLAYIHLATTPDGGASYHLPRMAGQKRAAEIALLGDRFGAAEAERWGLVNRVLPPAVLEAETTKLAARLARGPALAYARTKALLNASASRDLEAQLDAEAESFAASAMTEDFAAGVAAFLEKKAPVFSGK